MTQPIHRRSFSRGELVMLGRRLPRRVFLERALRAGTLGAAALWTPGVLAEELIVTPSSSSLEGPFYPDKMPLDTDNDLLIVNDSITPAAGEVTHLHGTVTTRAGTPLRNAFVEIWQCDANQNYRHADGVREDVPPDANFQGYGRFLTNAKGEYYFRTIKPVPYIIGDIFRTPHIHFGVSRHGAADLHVADARQRSSGQRAGSTHVADRGSGCEGDDSGRLQSTARVEDRRADRAIRHRARPDRRGARRRDAGLGPRPARDVARQRLMRQCAGTADWSRRCNHVGRGTARRSWLAVMLALAGAGVAAVQEQESEGGQVQDGDRALRRLPAFGALDTDDDGEISAAEIDAAAESLATLDEDGDGRPVGGRAASPARRSDRRTGADPARRRRPRS